MASSLASHALVSRSHALAWSSKAGAAAPSIPRGNSRALPCHVGLRRVQLSAALKLSGRREQVPRCQGVRAKESEGGLFGKIGTLILKGGKKAPEPEPEPPKGTGWFSRAVSKASGTQLRGGAQKGGAEKGTVGKRGTAAQKAGTARAGGTAQRFAAVAQEFVQRNRPSDPKTVFVSGATGQTGVRVARELLAAGFNVRAGVSDPEEANRLLDVAVQYELITREEAKRVSVVEYNVSDVNSIASSIGNAGKVVLALGANENGPKGRLGAQDGLRVLEAAQLANSSHFVLVSSKGGSSSGGGGGGFFAGLFGGGGGGAVSDRTLVDKIAESGLTYTIVRAGADGESEGNLVVAEEGASLGGKVSKADVAELVAGALTDLELAKNKVLEVSTSADAPSKSINELLSSVGEDSRYKEFVNAKQRAEEEAAAAEKRAQEAAEEAERREQAQGAARAAAEEAQAAEARKKELEAEAKQLQAIEARAAAAREKAQARLSSAGTAVQSIAARAEQMDLGSLDALAASAKKATSSFGRNSFFNRAEQGAEDAGEAVVGGAKKVAARAKPVASRAARSEPVKEAKKAAGGFNFGSVLPKKETVEETVKEAKKGTGIFTFGSAAKKAEAPVKEARKAGGFALGSLLPKKAKEATNGAATRIQKAQPVAAAKKQAAKVSSQAAKVGSQAQKAAPKKGGKGLFGGLLPSEDDYIYED